jgi:trimeric autotransporter adhesin
MKMKQIQIILFLLVFASVSIFAQAPQKMSFQAVIRNASNNLITSATVGIKISIVQTTPTGTVVYSESHTPTTNINGLASIEIGTGTVLSGTFSTINWGAGPYFIKNEVDPTGGTTYTISNTSQIMSTPYALYAENTGNSWNLKGNNGTNDSTNFVGTTDNIPLNFRVNNQKAGKLDHLLNSTFLGFNAGASNISGLRNTVFGDSSFYKNKVGNDNIAIGNSSLFSNTFGFGNVSIGNSALYTNTTGYNNLSIGANTLYSNVSGSDNIALGTSCLNKNTTGYGNIAIGSYALFKNTIGARNTSLGEYALEFNISGSSNISIGFQTLTYNTTGSNNVAIGSEAMRSNLTGIVNTAIGGNALYTNTIGIGNTALGSQALYLNNIGNNNTANGRQSLFSNTSGNNNVAFGLVALRNNTTGSNNVAIGSRALYNNTTSNSNTSIGDSSLYTNTVGSRNTANGYAALTNNSTGSHNTALGYLALTSNTTADFNTALGDSSLFTNTIGSRNTANGYAALVSNLTGNNNTAFGSQSLNSNIIGSGNVALGFSAGFNETGSNKLYIENTNSSTPLIYGEFDNDILKINGKIKVNTVATPGNEMQINNSNNFTHSNGIQNFGSGSDEFMISSREGSGETAGVYGDGNTVSIWSAGDANQGQSPALVYFLDEDLFDAVDNNPYNNTALKSYISPAGAYVQISDKNKKENIVKIENSLEKIEKISGYTYQFKLAPSEILKGDKPIKSSGVLAQELELILPEAVQKNEAGDYFVDYAAITPLLIEAIKEQNTKMKAMDMVNSNILSRLKALEELLSKK